MPCNEVHIPPGAPFKIQFIWCHHREAYLTGRWAGAGVSSSCPGFQNYSFHMYSCPSQVSGARGAQGLSHPAVTNSLLRCTCLGQVNTAGASEHKYTSKPARDGHVLDARHASQRGSSCRGHLLPQSVSFAVVATAKSLARYASKNERTEGTRNADTCRAGRDNSWTPTGAQVFQKPITIQLLDKAFLDSNSGSFIAV